MSFGGGALGAMLVGAVTPVGCLRAETGGEPGENPTVSGVQFESQRMQLGLFGDFGVDDGDVSVLAAGGCDWVVWRHVTLHGSFGLESRLNAFIRLRNAFGCGYMFESGRSSIPVWIAPGVVTTGLWDRYLNREFLSVGVGYRYHPHPSLGIGANLDVAFFGRGVSEQRISAGLIWSIRSARDPGKDGSGERIREAMTPR